MATPWGSASDLRSRQLPPGPSTEPAAVERNQRERLYGATVAAVAEHGYEATRVADIIEIAGVSRSAFYRYFDNKLDCFLATLDELAGLAEAQLSGVYRDESRSWRERMRAVLDGFVEMVLAQPGAARIWLVEIYAAGPLAVDRMERLADRLELLASRAIGETTDGAELPIEGVRALLGGLRQIIHTRLRHGREDELPALVPDLLDWVLSYRSPPVPLRRPRKPPRLPEPTANPDEQCRQILTAVTGLVAEKGYQTVTITEISQHAAISLSTFYNHFESKQAAFLAAIDDSERQVVEAILPVYRREPDWRRAARDTIHAFFAFNATHPAMSWLGGMRMFAGGEYGFDRHEQATGRFGAVLDGGYRERPGTSPIVAEAVRGSVAALIYQGIRRRGPERLYEVAGIASFIALAPFVGADEACALANEGWQPAPA
ncbi:MAG: TetR/AcrR family transcriptional regulator [Actinomycetota bacterium]|nr:TetR/AcrR family transcriptional regulator [Actinomycetota bacterium]